MATYEFHNRSRAVLRFPVYGRAEPRVKGQAGQLFRKVLEDLVLGDKNDEDLPPGVARGPKCPSPVQHWSDEDLARLSDKQRRKLDAYVAAKTVTRQQIAG